MTWTADKLKAFKRAYNKAVKEAKTEFDFLGNVILVAYAKYLIEYLETIFPNN
jgi:hypothetical protein